MDYECGVRIDNKVFRLRVAGIIVENGCVLFAKNKEVDYLYSIGGGVYLGETIDDAVMREVYEETGIHYEIDHLAIIHENFFNQSTGTFDGLDVHEVCFYYVMKPKGNQILNSSSYTHGVYEEMHWIPINELSKYKAFPKFMPDYLCKSHEGIEHIITNDLK